MFPLFRQLGVVAFGRVKPAARRLSRSLIGGAIAAVFGMTAYVALLVALGLYLSQFFGPVLAALGVAGITALAAGIVVLVVQRINRRAQLRLEARQRAARSRLPDPMTLQLLAGIPALMKGRSILTTAAIAAMVFAVVKSQGAGSQADDD
ncbi:hypothetical protein [Rhizobium sp. AAP43]|uniref:hypothetical protein n=1 Tax=Rhizobium sp. AAP43 TaxID=1523420 RepID=UPI0006B8AF07|nr:hypothetical protein [Rhizobium sp. AAP43]KPF46171.1 hypothetical protein IP76_04455 [Rhizobium sp. AAP43]